MKTPKQPFSLLKAKRIQGIACLTGCRGNEEDLVFCSNASATSDWLRVLIWAV